MIRSWDDYLNSSKIIRQLWSSDNESEEDEKDDEDECDE